MIGRVSLLFVLFGIKELYPPIPSEFVDWSLKSQADVSFLKQMTKGLRLKRVSDWHCEQGVTQSVLSTESECQLIIREVVEGSFVWPKNLKQETKIYWKRPTYDFVNINREATSKIGVVSIVLYFVLQRQRTQGTPCRGGRYIDEKLSKADKSVFLKLSATYRYRKMEILKLSKNYRYRKMHQILADK